jgi:type I restriction enzyme S subunit
MVSNGWNSVRVGALIDAGVLVINDGYRVTNKERGPHGIPFVRGGDTGDGAIRTNVTDHIVPEFQHRVSTKLTQAEDIAFITKGTVGRVGFMRPGQPHVVFAPQISYWRVRDTRSLCPRFFYYLLKGHEFQSSLHAVKTHGSMVADYVSLTDQRSFRLTVPPLADQVEIAQILGALDDKIDLNRRMNETLEAMARALFKESEAKSRTSESRVEALIEQGILMIGDGYRAKRVELAEQGLPFARAGNLKNGFDFSEAEYLGDEGVAAACHKIAQPLDVAFTSKGTVGRITQVTSRTPQFVYSPQVCFWRVLDHSAIDPYVLYEWMKTPGFLGQLEAVKGQTDMADLVSLTDQRRMSITLPGKDEQAELGRLLKPMSQRIALNNAQSRTLSALRDALLTKLLSGEIRVKDAEILVEAHV